MAEHSYLRTSTEDQTNGIAAQRLAIELRFPAVVEHVEHASGKNMTGRPVFTELIDSLGEGDTLVVAKLDRFARSVADAVETASYLMDKGVRLVVLDLDMDFSTPIGKLVFSVLASVAEFERNMISQRTKDGLAVVKASGTVLGKPSSVDCEWVATLRGYGYSHREIAERTGYSKSAVQRCISREGLK
jgi:DNA invertase Pin-like site-specific DNA recombinase